MGANALGFLGCLCTHNLAMCLGTAKSSLEGGAVGIFHARGSVVHTVTALGIALALKIWAELVHGSLAT